MNHILKDGSTLNITSYHYDAINKINYNIGILTDDKCQTICVKYTDDEYYNLLKDNNAQIPYSMLRRDDVGYDSKDDADIADYQNTTKYVLNNGDELYISNECAKSDPCRHHCISSGKRRYLNGRTIAKLLVGGEPNDLGHFESYLEVKPCYKKKYLFLLFGFSLFVGYILKKKNLF
jgi:hypothetical protein